MALTGKIAVVTGAALGIGKAMTEILLQNGATVVLLDVNDNAGKSLKEFLDKQHGQERTLFLNCDVESDEQLKDAFQKIVQTFGGVDILCNNAGILDERKLEKCVSINLVGVIKVTYLALELMNKMNGGRGGVIINTASMAGLAPFLCCPVYTATKYGVVGFTQAMAAASSASGYGIRFNALCPGFVQTDLFTKLFDGLGQFSHLADVVTTLAGKGVLTVTEVAEAFLDLLLDETKNGEALMLTPMFKKYMTFPSFTQ